MAKAPFKKATRRRKPSTEAGKFVRDEIDEIRAGEHGAANTKQAIAIGLAKARRAGVKVGKNPNRQQKAAGKKKSTKPSPESSATRSRAATAALKKEPCRAVSKAALSRHAKSVARRRK